ncbi:hypothetical protein [Paradesertivirga mongoliensis]|uniref:hypothetical protein n=1 Tax=Paradesertivirga mongoliensis TaxID=2100740 RepID=UPI00210C07E3
MGDFKLVGRQLFEGHEGLKSLYEVSCDETDYLVDQASRLSGVLGARMLVADFGGCTINLIKSESLKK